ncbi:hypothetical protein DNTS_028422 [Danionella cerebrum]|uniref:Ribosome-recycling factor, mitochondrial n=1 Tax=Danionella cerebrum TaxID=2873325 RepID=A0A553NW42_9TELE|nr:hypothetical protein DNTS_028422 [Danionella translucida]
MPQDLIAMALVNLNLLRPVLCRFLPPIVRTSLVTSSQVLVFPQWRHCVVLQSSVRDYATKKPKAKAKGQTKVNINAALVEDVISLDEVKEDMAAILTNLKEDFIRNLSIRTSAGALDHIAVTTRDGKFPLNQLGQISMKSPHLLVVNMTSYPEVWIQAADDFLAEILNPNNTYTQVTEGQCPALQPLSFIPWDTVLTVPRGTSCTSLRPSLALARAPSLGDAAQLSWIKGSGPSTDLEGGALVKHEGWRDAIAAATRALRESNMGLNPDLDGNIIRVPLPKVTREHRENLVKQAKQLSNKAKDSLRKIRSNAITEVKKSKDTVSGDTIHLIEKQIKQMADALTADIDKLLATKSKELLG